MKIMYYFPFLFAILFAIPTCKKDPEIPPPVGSKHLKITVLAKNLTNPWGMAYLPNGDFLFLERSGNIDFLKKGELNHKTIMTRTVEVSEGGLLGLAIDPDYNNNHYIFIYETVTTGNQVVRLTFINNVLSQDKVILSGIPKANNHDGGALRFGPDGYLYLGTGDAEKPDLAQDRNSLAGKILRMDKEGNPAPGNPFNNHVWTYGHRNVQGFDWNKQGKMFATEHGPSGEFGWCCHDEINFIEPGKNYGWPIAIGGKETDSLTPAASQSGMEVWAPSGCTFINGKEWGQWEGNFIFACLRGQRLVRFSMSASGDALRSRNDTLIKEFHRLRNIIQAPDGALLFSTSNKGSLIPLPQAEDDKIYRMSFE